MSVFNKKQQLTLDRALRAQMKNKEAVARYLPAIPQRWDRIVIDELVTDISITLCCLQPHVLSPLFNFVNMYGLAGMLN